MPRIQLPTPDEAPEAFELLRAKRGHAPTAQVFRMLAICPDILEAFIPMADAVRQGCGIDPKLREMAIVMACQTMGSSYEHDPHWNRAIKEGVPKEKMLALWDFEKSELFSELEKAVLRLSRDATRAPAQVSNEVWEAVHRELGSQQSVALLFSIGWYNMTGRLTGPLELSNEDDFTRL
ncbi:carboxymuconolactone decarboxylase family protein [Aestuariicella hydrocarbonica]|uniref:Carboxymuconolactone decarboxylase family protein n=1 Tax=Pseudomaricurvus hydrocarbonicus TaxID=1470433 RepID=A0A9E5MQ97_9GAMM|nr:carboxymuconolactone decarboxylase family protein [Aestuariicella hydrocarbonica]NHO68322.1 carboxymuconolactone decarboxylase family protein [Aestuariicella hydrocarbonica]